MTIFLAGCDRAPRKELYPTNELDARDIVEGRRHLFDVRIDGEQLPLTWKVRIGHEFAERLIVDGMSYFAYDPGFRSGHLGFKVLDGERVVHMASLVVDPSRAKLAADQYATMLRDLAEWTRALYRTVGASLAAPTAAGETNRLVTFNLIDAHIDLLEAAMHRLADRPVVRFSSADDHVPFFRAKSVTGPAIRHALRGPALRAATETETLAAPAFVAALGGHVPARIRQRRRSRHTAIYEHRALLGFLCWLDGVCVGLASALAPRGGASKNMLSADIGLWRAKIAEMRKRDIFAGIDPETDLRPTNIFTMNPSYRSAFSIAMKLRHGLGPGSCLVSLPIAETPVLYEMWCWAGLLLAVATEYPAARASIRNCLLGAASEDGIGWILPKGETSTIAIGKNLVLNYQLGLGPRNGRYGLRTLLVGAVPDVSFAHLDAGGDADAVVVLDPKYRTGTSLDDGLRSLHFYRDAIVSRDGRKPIVGAIAMHPDESDARRLPLLSREKPTATLFRPGGEADFKGLIIASIEALTVPNATDPV